MGFFNRKKKKVSEPGANPGTAPQAEAGDVKIKPCARCHGEMRIPREPRPLEYLCPNCKQRYFFKEKKTSHGSSSGSPFGHRKKKKKARIAAPGRMSFKERAQGSELTNAHRERAFEEPLNELDAELQAKQDTTRRPCAKCHKIMKIPNAPRPLDYRCPHCDQLYRLKVQSRQEEQPQEDRKGTELTKEDLEVILGNYLTPEEIEDFCSNSEDAWDQKEAAFEKLAKAAVDPPKNLLENAGHGMICQSCKADMPEPEIPGLFRVRCPACSQLHFHRQLSQEEASQISFKLLSFGGMLPEEQEKEQEEEKLCPHCNKFIDSGWTVCQWCGKDLKEDRRWDSLDQM